MLDPAMMMGPPPGPPMGAPEMGPPPMAEGPPPEPAGDPIVAILKECIMRLNEAQEQTPDEADALLIQQAVLSLQKALANDQQMFDKAMGSPDISRMLRKSG